MSAANVGKIVGKEASVTVASVSSQYLTITMPVRTGGTFTGATSKAAAAGGVQYTVEGSDDLATFNDIVVEVSPALSSGMPALSAGWEYKTFRYNTKLADAPKNSLRLKAAPVTP